MSKRLLFSLTGILVILMVIFFSVKISAKIQDDCTPFVSSDCMDDWGDICYATYGGDMIGWDLLWGYCYSGDCLGIYTIICDNGFERRAYRDTCVDTSCWQCNIQ